jgi:ATP-dependent RNA helicase DeaD
MAQPEPEVAPVATAQPAPPVDEPPAAPARPPAPPRRLSPEQRGKPRALPAWQRPAAAATPASSAGGFLRFRINWGRRDGADPRRVMAHVCRRGGIASRQVGAIDVRVAATTFEVASDVADGFLRAVQRRDAREPHLVIVRDRDS